MCHGGQEVSRGKVSVEMIYPLDEDVFLWKSTHAALLHPIEVEENSHNQYHQKDEVLCSVRKMFAKELLLEALRKLCWTTQYDPKKDKKRQLSSVLRKHSAVFQLNGEPLGRTDLKRHDVKISSYPMRQPPQRFPIGLRKEADS